MKNIGGILMILLFAGVFLFRFYAKNGHLPFMKPKEVKGVPYEPNQRFTLSYEEYKELTKPKVFEDVLEKNRKSIVQNPPVIPAHTYKRSQNSTPKNNNSIYQQLLAKPCSISKELNQIVQSCDFTSPEVRTEAITLASANPGNYNLGQMCDIFDYAKGAWKYVNDPIGNEYVAKASETINNNYIGDCDDFAVTLGSMLMAVGGDIRINYAFGDAGGHAYVEANLGDLDFAPIVNYIKARYQLNDTEKIRVRKDKRTGNLWLNMDWFQDNPGGTYFNYKKGTSYYVVDQSCETFNLLTDLTWYEYDNEKKLRPLKELKLEKKPTYQSEEPILKRIN